MFNQGSCRWQKERQRERRGERKREGGERQETEGGFFFFFIVFSWIFSGLIPVNVECLKLICSIIFLVGWMDGRVRERLRLPLPFRVLLRLRLRLGYDWDATVTRASIASIESNAKTQPGYVTLSVPSTLVLLDICWQNWQSKLRLSFFLVSFFLPPTLFFSFLTE